MSTTNDTTTPADSVERPVRPDDALKHLREVTHQYRQMHNWRLRYQCEDPEPGAQRKEDVHRIALVLAMADAEKFLADAEKLNTDLGLPVSAYDAGGDVLIQAAKQIDGSTLWAVRRTGACLSKEGEWEYEPLPSNRDADFLSRCRYATPHEAYGALKAKRAKPD